MFKNIENKIKFIAILVFILSIFSTIGLFIAFVSISVNFDFFCYYLFIPMIFSPFLGYITSAFIYAFGEIVENTTLILNKINQNE